MKTFTEVSSIIRNYNFTENSFLPHLVTIPLSQEFGITCKPLVKSGDIVKEGEIIAATDNSSFIHSSMPGTVQNIVPCLCPSGNTSYAIQIKSGGSFTYLGKNNKEIDFSEIDFDSVAENLEKNGIVNTFNISKPENLGRELKNNKKAKYLIVRLFDEDNFRYTDSLISKFYLREVLKAADALACGFGAKGIILANNTFAQNKKLLHSLEKKERNENLDVNVSLPLCVVDMNVKLYPSGTKREILSAYNRNYKKTAGFEASKNDIFTDSSTLYQVYKTLYEKIPSISRPVFFSGNCLNVSCILDVRIGTSVSDVVQQIGGFVKKPVQILINGMICGNSLSTCDIPITKYVKSVTIQSGKKETDSHIYSCVNCGSCRTVCPPHLSPDLLYNTAANFRELPSQIERSALDCTNCGLCNIVCPSRLPLCQTITALKEKAILQDEKNKK